MFCLVLGPLETCEYEKKMSNLFAITIMRFDIESAFFEELSGKNCDSVTFLIDKRG